jgi:hypothetical protein
LYFSESLDVKKSNFVKGLIELTDIPVFGAVHAKILFDYLEDRINQGKLSKSKTACLKNIKMILEPLKEEDRFFMKDEFIKLIENNEQLNQNCTAQLKKIINNGSYAALAYNKLRNNVVHHLDPQTISFDKITFYGQPVPGLNFDICFKALTNIYENTKNKYLNVNKN